MPRAKRSPPRDKATAIAQFAEHAILDVRLGQRGQVQKVKHVQFGWIDPEVYYQLQKVKDAMPIIQAFVQGGYQAKAALWSLSVVIGPVTLPIGAYFPVKALLMLQDAIGKKDAVQSALWAYALLGPFGDVLTALQLYVELGNILGPIFADPEGNPDWAKIAALIIGGPFFALIFPKPDFPET